MLEGILSKKFKFGVEVLELARYQNALGDVLYRFEPFLAEFRTDVAADTTETSEVDVSVVDTLIVPARDDGFEEVFLNENRWYAIRIHGSMRPQIKYLAAYRVAPTSAITHVAPVQSIEPWKESSKFVVNFAEPAKAIGPIPLVKGGKVRPPQAPRYAIYDRLVRAKTLDDIW